MRSGIFDHGNFTRAQFRDANIGWARFRGAIFDGADLRCLGLDEADLTGASCDKHTVWPAGFSPEDHGVVVR
jgi:uncharacterized protein YjbI with pentapeptide repeats